MTRYTPYKGTSAERLIQMINLDNGKNYQLGVDVHFGPPIHHIDQDGRNTRVTVTPAAQSNYLTPEDVYYWRLSLTVLDELPPGHVRKVVVPGFPFSTHSILDQINDALGLDLSPEEVANYTYESEQALYRLDIMSNVSLAWNSGAFFKTRLESDPQELSEVILQRSLNGLNYIPPVG